MISTKQKPQTKRKIFFYFMLILIILFGLSLGYMAIRENHRHTQLENSINSLQTSLNGQGIIAQKTSGCGSPYSEVGTEGKSCAIALQTVKTVHSQIEANQIMKAYAVALASNDKFVTSDPLPLTLPDVRNGVDFGSRYYSVPSIRKNCSASYDYTEIKHAIIVSFSCDDTSWFVRTFEN